MEDLDLSTKENITGSLEEKKKPSEKNDVIIDDSSSDDDDNLIATDRQFSAVIPGDKNVYVNC